MMMNTQWTIVLIILSTVQIYLANGQCPPINICSFVNCGNGTCISNSTVPNCHVCQCNAGYTGRYCEVNLATSCPENFCQNGGVCRVNGNVLTCDCPATHIGTTCEIPLTTVATTTVGTVTATIGSCPANICLNGGTCYSFTNTFVCVCAAGYTGVRCETAASNSSTLPSTTTAVTSPTVGTTIGTSTVTATVGSCPANICLNGGTCYSFTNTFVCVCAAGYTGVRCETAASNSSTLPTTTAGVMSTTATVTLNSSTTAPAPGSCASRPCVNGGTCYSTGNSFFCFCPTQYTGRTCDVQNSPTTVPPSTVIPINACAPNPCNNGGTCYRHGNSFVCLCTPYHTGANCETVKVFTTPSVTTPSSTVTCANQPCQNGASCYTSGNSYFCYCGGNSNFTGKNCETLKVQSGSDCPLQCASGYCIRTGSAANPYACMCGGVLSSSACPS